jgi:hypothetical protein
VLLLHRGFAERRSILARARAVHANIVHNLGRPGRSRHTCGGAFVLADAGISFPRHHAVLNMEAKSIFSNFRFRQFGADRGVELRIANGGAADGSGRCFYIGRKQQRSGKKWQEQEE